MIGKVDDMSPSTSAQAATSDGTVRPLADDLHWLAVRLARGLSIAEDEAVRRHGLTLRGYVVLCEIAQGPVHSQLAIARSACVDRSTLVGLLDELESDGLVARRADPADRRARIVEVTGAGLSMLRAATIEVRAIEGQFLQNVTPRQRRELFQILQKIATGPLVAGFDTQSCV